MNAAFLILRRLILSIASIAFVAALGAAENPRSGESVIAALGDAHALAAHRPDLKVVRVSGDSMLPFFGDGAVLVVKRISLEKLRVGMVAVYTNRFHETVAHRLVSYTGTGWEARGYNNAEPDSTVITGANLIGVVYATFHSDDRFDSPAVASLAAGTPLALAAPAR